MKHDTRYAEVPITKIISEDRGRQVVNIDTLAVSIKTHGLIAPLAVCDMGDGVYKLIAGGRRYAACIMAGVDPVKVCIYPPEMSSAEQRVIELIENTEREDLTWQEEIWLRRELHGVLEKSCTTPMHKHSMRDTAARIGVDVATMSRDLRLAETMDNLPPLQECKTKKDANDLIRKLTRTTADAAAVKAFESKKKPSDTLYDIMKERYITGDFLSVDLPQNFYKFVEVDPPYGIDLCNLKDVGGAQRLMLQDQYHEEDKDTYFDFITKVLMRCHTAMLKDSWIVVWYAVQYYSDIMNILKAVGFKPNQIPYIWNKVTPAAQCNCPNLCLANNYEAFIYAHKGVPELAYKGAINVGTVPPIPSALKIHPTERPAILMQKLLSIFSRAGDNVLVPFAGSGIMIKEAHAHSRTAVGYDITEDYRMAFLNQFVT